MKIEFLATTGELHQSYENISWGILLGMKEGEIKHKLSPAQVSVMQHRVTEPPYFGKYWDHFEDGIYRCGACDTPLFASSEKFDSKTGWPSFRKPINERDLQFKSEAGPDDKVELRCKKCKSHLGYVIAGETPYYRINSVCLLFEAAAPTAAHVDSSVKGTVPKKEMTQEENLPVIEMNPASESSWNVQHILAGVLIGAILGSSLTTLYHKRAVVPVSDSATTTTQVATTTNETPLDEEPISPTPTPEPEPTTPDEETPIQTLETANPVPDTSTSTQ